MGWLKWQHLSIRHNFFKNGQNAIFLYFLYFYFLFSQTIKAVTRILFTALAVLKLTMQNFSALMNGFAQANAKKHPGILLYLCINDTGKPKDDIPFTQKNTAGIMSFKVYLHVLSECGSVSTS